MSKISGKNTKPELIIRKLVYNKGYRYRLHKSNLPGKPDLVFSKYKKVIFVNGCFWHNHKNCSRSTLPTTNEKFWKDKIEGNVKKDRSNYSQLRKMGWDFLVIWQCQIKKSSTDSIMNKIEKFLKKDLKN